MLQLANHQTLDALQNIDLYRGASQSVLSAVHADVRYVLHLLLRKIHLILLLMPTLVCRVLVFDLRRKNLMESKVPITYRLTHIL